MTAAARPTVPSEIVRTAPERIWLQISDDADHCSEPFPADHEGITWCQESVLACEVEYVRADAIDAANERIARLDAALRERDRRSADIERALEAAPTTGGNLHIVFDGPPSHESGRFVEVEDDSGKSVNAGEWKQRPNGLWELVILGREAAPPTSEEVERAAKMLEALAVLNDNKSEWADLLRRLDRERQALQHDIERYVARDAEAQTALAQARKDAERYQYLRSPRARFGAFFASGDALDLAVDAAIAREGQ